MGKVALAGVAGAAGGGITAAANLVTKVVSLGKVGGAAMKGLGEINAAVAGDIIQGKTTTAGGTMASIAGGKAVGAVSKVVGEAAGKTLSKVGNSRPAKGTPNGRSQRRQMQRVDKRAGKVGAEVGGAIGSGAGGKAADLACSKTDSGC